MARLLLLLCVFFWHVFIQLCLCLCLCCCCCFWWWCCCWSGFQLLCILRSHRCKVLLYLLNRGVCSFIFSATRLSQAAVCRPRFEHHCQTEMRKDRTAALLLGVLLGLILTQTRTKTGKKGSSSTAFIEFSLPLLLRVVGAVSLIICCTTTGATIAGSPRFSICLASRPSTGATTLASSSGSAKEDWSEKRTSILQSTLSTLESEA